MAATDNAQGKPRARDKKGSGPKSSRADQDLLTVTIHAKTGLSVKIERVSGPHAHHELTAEEKASLAKEAGDVGGDYRAGIRGRNSFCARG